MDYSGNDKGRVITDSEVACVEACGAISVCKFWTFNKESKNCLIKSSNVGKNVVPVSVAVSGSKECAGNTMAIYLFDKKCINTTHKFVSGQDGVLNLGNILSQTRAKIFILSLLSLNVTLFVQMSVSKWTPTTRGTISTQPPPMGMT